VPTTDYSLLVNYFARMNERGEKERETVEREREIVSVWCSKFTEGLSLIISLYILNNQPFGFFSR